MPGLFQGLSGIGYTLLRFSAPQAIPGVLLL
jgi:lantibiotic modifying enzyme